MCFMLCILTVRRSTIFPVYPSVRPSTRISRLLTGRNNDVDNVVKTVVDIEDSDGTEISSNTFTGRDGHFV